MRKGTVLVVDDESDLLEVLGKELSDSGYDVQIARNGKDGLETARRISPDLLLLDINMPGMDGIQVKTSLNLSEATVGIPTIFLSGSTQTNLKVKGFHLGASDYVTKPFNVEELMARVDSTILRHQHSIEMSMTDKLTGLYNLHVYKKQAANLFDCAKRYGRNYSLAILDVDHLKIINDTRGHKTGDFVIKKTAEVMRMIFRRPDILIRYGGDEFVVLFPESSIEQAESAIQRFKQAIENPLFVMEESSEPIGLSISSGLASYETTLRSEEELFEVADQHLYQEKALKKAR